MAHRLGLPAKTVCKFCGIVTGHQAACASPMRLTGQRPSTRSSTAGPDVSVGTNIRSFHAMISWKRPKAESRSRIVSVKPDSSMRLAP